MIKYCVYDHKNNKFYTSMTITAIADYFNLSPWQVRHILSSDKPRHHLSIGKPDRLKIDRVPTNLR